MASLVREVGCVTISLGLAAAPGTAEEGAAVVDAVLAASPAGELDCVEWKSSLDLGSRTVRGILARNIPDVLTDVSGTEQERIAAVIIDRFRQC